MKYRRLNKEELEELEPEFVRFLATNGIPASDWVKMKDDTPSRVNALIEQFSDIVFERILSNVTHLEHRSPRDLRLFRCDKDKIYLIGLKLDGATTIDFTENIAAETMLKQFKNAPFGASLKMYRAEKSYKKTRELELFDMMENGALISKGKLYQLLDTMNK